MARIKQLAARALGAAAFAAATGFFWGAAEALLNRRWPPKGVWQPDILLHAVAGRVVFYAVLAAAAVALAAGARALWRLVRKKETGQGRGWRRWVAVGAVAASNVGWWVVGRAGGYELAVGGLTLDLQWPGPFFGYWAFWLAAGAGAALALGFALGRRRWPRTVGKYVRAVGAAAFVAAVGGRAVADAARPVPRGPNVVLVVLDAWRADAFNPTLMPKTTAAARARGLVFVRTWANATWTLPSVATMFTGQYPDYHVTRQMPNADARSPTLAQELWRAGYDTAALSANRILDRNSTLTDGFEDFRFTTWSPLLRAARFYDTNWYCPAVRELFASEPTSAESRTLTAWLVRYASRRHHRPYFLWVHYVDPHGPYRPPPGYYAPGDEKYITDYHPFTKKRRFANKRLYDGECRYVDDLLGPALPRLAADRRTVTILTADHGEEFWEHGKFRFGHGKSVYETLLRVPLVVFAPGARAATVETPVSLVDLAPTVLALAGRRPPATMQGRPFLSAKGTPVDPGHPVFAGSSFFRLGGQTPPREDAMVAWPYKLILNHDYPATPAEFYNLADDPGEKNSLPEDKTAAAMRRQYKAWQAFVHEPAPTPGGEYGGAAAPDLRALGYIR